MNHKIILLSVVTASMLFTGCGSSDGFTAENKKVEVIPPIDDTQEVAIVDKEIVKEKVQDEGNEEGKKIIVSPVSKPKVIDPVTISGYIIDGPIKDATVFMDLNNDNVEDTNEQSTTTNEEGFYSLIVERADQYGNTITSQGGVDVITGKPFTSQIKKVLKEGDSLEGVISSPATTLVEQFINNNNINADEAKTKVARFLDIEESQLLKNPTKDLELYKKNLMLVKYVEFLDNGYEDLASQMESTSDNIDYINNSQTYILDEIYKVLRKLTFIPKAGEGNGAIDTMRKPTFITNQEVVENIQQKLTFLGENESEDNITKDFSYGDILESYRKDTFIEFKGDYISTDGTITRPKFGEEAVETDITVVVSKAEAQVSRKYPFIFTPADITSIEAFDIAKKLLTFDKIKGDNISPDSVISDLVLPEEFDYGVKAEYSSTNDAIQKDGNVTQPISFDIEAMEGIFKIILSINGVYQTEIVEHKLKVPTLTLTDEEAVLAAIEEFETILSSQNDIIYNNLSKENFGAIYSYSSNKPNNLTVDGNITHPAVGEDDIIIDINVTASKGEHNLSKEFTATIPALEIQKDELEYARDDLNFDNFKNANSDMQKITTDLNLISSLDGYDGVVISWLSNDEKTISSAGVVTQPIDTEGGKSGVIKAEAMNVILTATLSLYDKEDLTKDFNLIVLPAEEVIPEPIPEPTPVLPQAKEALDFDDIKNANSDAKEITTDLNLVTSLDEFEGVVIEWASSDETAISTAGVVTQPQEKRGKGGTTPADPIDVTLTATLSKDGETTITKDIPVTVLPE